MITYAAIFTLTALVSVELGAEFFLAINSALNLITFIIVQRSAKKVSHVEDVASQLDSRVEGGRRDYDPNSPDVTE